MSNDTSPATPVKLTQDAVYKALRNHGLTLVTTRHVNQPSTYRVGIVHQKATQVECGSDLNKVVAEAKRLLGDKGDAFVVDGAPVTYVAPRPVKTPAAPRQPKVNATPPADVVMPADGPPNETKEERKNRLRREAAQRKKNGSVEAAQAAAVDQAMAEHPEGEILPGAMDELGTDEGQPAVEPEAEAPAPEHHAHHEHHHHHETPTE